MKRFIPIRKNLIFEPDNPNQIPLPISGEDIDMLLIRMENWPYVTAIRVVVEGINFLDIPVWFAKRFFVPLGHANPVEWRDWRLEIETRIEQRGSVYLVTNVPNRPDF